MKRLAWAASGLTLVIVTLTMLSGNGELAQAQLPAGRTQPLTSRNPGIIEATDCAIMLIDEAVLAAERPGIIAECEFEEGDPVVVGNVLVKLKDGVARAARDTAAYKASNKINEEYQRLAKAVALKELEIAEEANRNLPGTVPQLEIEKLKLAAQRGELALKQAEFESETNRKLLAEADEQLKTYNVIAPFDGVVSKVHRHRGEAVTQGAPILEIISTNRMKVEGYVAIPESYVIQKGDRVVLQIVIEGAQLAIESKPIDGEIVLVDPKVEPLLKKVKVTAHVEKKEDAANLKEGLKIRMAIMPKRTARARTLPRR
ncbi:MAG: HlyD family efflux transporter periplasmic adaptor subunit [Planctomycetes bacterium]|nr:HlyD family efflux transporter periplasmic adaptor subunit [Planctomycetota bacterium]